MDIKIWWIWLILAAVFVIGETFTAGFFLLWFGIGAALAGVLALAGLGPIWQWISFIVVSFILFAISRRFSDRFTKAQPPGIGADRAIGMQGKVIQTIDHSNNTGRVLLEREEWLAESVDGEPIAEGEQVIIEQVEGTRLIVRLSEKGE